MVEVLVAGAGGMLGSAFVEHFGGKAAALGRAYLDVGHIQTIIEAVAASGARLVMNCAAHTDVDGAEIDPDDAWRVNALLPGILATACRRVGATLVHFSSTGIYGNWKNTPYDENDVPAPTTVHHRSKLAGEVAVRESGCDHLILRTGWLFGGAPGHTKNFVWKRILEASGTSGMTSDATQRGNPTAITDVVAQTIAVAESGFRGTLNLVSRGSASRFEYVSRIVAAAGMDCQVLPTTTPFKRAANVSHNEAAVNRRLGLLGFDRMPSWEAAVDAYVAHLKASPAWSERSR